MADSQNVIAEAVINIRATADNLERVVTGAKESIQGIGKAADQTRRPLNRAGVAGKAAGRQMAAGAQEAQLAWAAVAVVVIASLSKINAAIDQSVEKANAYKDALRGLNSVAQYANISSTELEEATAKVTNQFMNAEAASTALKNLLLRGYSLDQAITTIQNLQNAAAYGRQASLSLSDAVKSATEGLKNENSILVDNAGVTKNVAKMWEDYAEAQGLSVASMTQAQKIEAEYQGIIQETAAMTGDLASLQETLSGKMAATENQTYLLTVAFGEDYAAIKSLEQDALKGLLEMLTELITTMPGVATGATAMTTSFLGMLLIVPTVQKVIKILKSLKLALASVNLSFGTLGLIALGIGAVVGAYTAIKAAIEKHNEELQAEIQKHREAVTAEEKRRDTLKDLLNTYVDLKKKTSLSYTEAYNLVDIENKLAEQYGITKEALDKLVSSTDDYATSLNGVINAATGAELLAAKQQQAADSLKTAQDSATDVYEHLTRDMPGNTLIAVAIDPDSNLGKKAIAQAEEKIDKAFSDINQLISDELEVTKQRVKNEGGAFNDEISQILTGVLIPQIDIMQFDDADAYIGFFENLASRIGDIASDAESSEAFESLQAFSEEIMGGVVPSDEAIEEAMQTWFDLLGPDSPIHEYLSALVDAGVLTSEQFDEAMMQLASAADPIGVIGESFEGTKERVEAAALSYALLSDEMSDAQKAAEEYVKTMKTIQSGLKTSTAMTNQVKQWRDLYAAYKEAAKNGKDTTNVIKNMTPYIKKMNGEFDGSEEAIEAANEAFESMAAYLPQRATELENEIATLQQQLWELDATDPEVLMDGDAALLIAAIAAAKGELEDLLTLMEAAGISFDTGGGGGGGGGGGSSSGGGGGSTITKSAYEKAIEQLEHLKALDQLTYEQELANLEDIAARRIADAEERLDLEERIYDVKKAIAERDAENLTDLSEAIITALEERYDAMRESELDALETSKDAWEEWRDSNVSAIQDQIDALNDLAEAEDRESDQEEYLRKIAKLEQSLAYEQDAYNQAQIQKQLEAAQDSYNEWLADIAREDQISALEDQIEAINNTADTEIEALDKQQEAIEAYYAERTTAANLQAEAELELINSTQQEIIELLAEYAPDYDAAGRTLGEKLMDGFTSAVGEFNAWFEAFTDSFTSKIDALTAQTVSAVSNRTQAYDEEGNPVSGINIQNEYNFNTPVETPAETARRIQQANEDLAEQLLGE